MRKNGKLKDLHKNERCFIIGNGPSVNSVNFDLIKNDIKFTVNSIMNNKLLFNTIGSDYHIFNDPAYFDTTKKNFNVLLSDLKSVKHSKGYPFIIIPYEGWPIVKDNHIDDSNNIFYVYSHRPLKTFIKTEIDLQRNIPISYNVIQLAIYVAIYMGFKKIYLLGCEMTSFLPNLKFIDSNEFEDNNYHAYEYSTNIKNQMDELKKSHDNSFVFNDYANIFDAFKHIKAIANERNIDIVNLTRGGILDVFKIEDIDVYKKNNL